ncbi:glycine-rich protein HC1-like [Phoenix dactylifera]|uniref:Glycine-rich protein HC1-like n=1 Tax=Phoenix dactylifera TaxID=42345 RepID=A0A8B7CWA4_PHODC|nr:glycine-rich protein HC1-like [Phoenix dactylifera]
MRSVYKFTAGVQHHSHPFARRYRTSCNLGKEKMTQPYYRDNIGASYDGAGGSCNTGAAFASGFRGGFNTGAEYRNGAGGCSNTGAAYDGSDVWGSNNLGAHYADGSGGGHGNIGATYKGGATGGGNVGACFGGNPSRLGAGRGG